MPSYLFYFFAIVSVLGALGVVLNRNPVSCAFSLIASFVGVAALFIGLNAYFIGTIQILVYAGAVMVLFLFIIMLLDIKAEQRKHFSPASIIGGVAVGVVFLMLAAGVMGQFEPGGATMPELAQSEGNDVKILGRVLYTDFNFPLQVVGVLLLVSTVGVVVLSKKELKN